MIRDYADAIAYLEHLFSSPIRSEPIAALERARLMLAYVDNPQRRFATLHITGSSGKGSTATMAATILRTAGYLTGAFTSPHLADYTERITLDGRPIAPEEWTRLLNRLRPMIEDMSANRLPDYTLGRPALFQVLWPLAALYFAEQGADIAVVEVGMGGRYDSTNINNARVAVITNISLEHTQHLGPTAASIAAHKAGVAKPGGILVTATHDPEALEVIRAECDRLGTTLWRVTPDGGDGDVQYGGDEDNLWVGTPRTHHDSLRLSLRGRHQRENAACAVAAIDALQSLDIVTVDEAAIGHGLAEAVLPGRLERIDGDPPIVLDGAHNPDAAHALSVALHDLFPEHRFVLLLGILSDKDIEAMVGWLAPLAVSVVVTEPPWAGRMGRGAEVAQIAGRYLHDVTYEPDVATALAAAHQRALSAGATLVISGSMALIGAARQLLLNGER